MQILQRGTDFISEFHKDITEHGDHFAENVIPVRNRFWKKRM